MEIKLLSVALKTNTIPVPYSVCLSESLSLCNVHFSYSQFMHLNAGNQN